MPKKTVTITHEYTVVLTKSFTYDMYGKTTLRKGTVMYKGKRFPSQLQDNGYVMIIGHGIDALVPNTSIKVIKTTYTVKSTKYTQSSTYKHEEVK
jgi:hypothetical protein